MTLMPIQEERLHFAPTNHRSSRELQDELKEATKTAIRGWRRGATSFRSDVGSKLTLILDKLEDSRMKGNSIALRNFNLPESVTKTRSVFGFPLHFAFTKIDEILDMIETTEIHGNMNPQVEFALGVRVFTYPGGLLSVWVFICSLVPIV